MSELRTELEYGLLDVVKKAVEGGAKNFDDLDAEASQLILYGSIGLADEIAAIPNFDAEDMPRQVRKYTMTFRDELTGKVEECNFCHAVPEPYNMLRDGIIEDCPVCHRHTFAFSPQKMAEWLMRNYRFAHILEMDTLHVYDDARGVWVKYAEEMIKGEL